MAKQRFPLVLIFLGLALFCILLMGAVVAIFDFIGGTPAEKATPEHEFRVDITSRLEDDSGIYLLEFEVVASREKQLTVSIEDVGVSTVTLARHMEGRVRSYRGTVTIIADYFPYEDMVLLEKKVIRLDADSQALSTSQATLPADTLLDPSVFTLQDGLFDIGKVYTIGEIAGDTIYLILGDTIEGNKAAVNEMKAGEQPGS